MQQALDMIRRELGPDATVLHTRECNAGLLGRIFLGRHFEVAASKDATVPAKMIVYRRASRSRSHPNLVRRHQVEEEFDYRNRYRNDFHANYGTELDELQFHVATSSAEVHLTRRIQKLPEALFEVYTDLIESDVEERVAQQLFSTCARIEAIDLHDRLWPCEPNSCARSKTTSKSPDRYRFHRGQGRWSPW